MPTRQQVGRIGGLVSWSRTVDRPARTRLPRSKSPGDVGWHYDRLDPELFANATEAQKLAAAESAKKAWFAGLALKSAAVRRGGGDDRAA
jgi:hypothetical protein